MMKQGRGGWNFGLAVPQTAQIQNAPINFTASKPSSDLDTHISLIIRVTQQKYKLFAGFHKKF